jgi:hypothetical protein
MCGIAKPLLTPHIRHVFELARGGHCEFSEAASLLGADKRSLSGLDPDG